MKEQVILEYVYTPEGNYVGRFNNAAICGNPLTVQAKTPDELKEHAENLALLVLIHRKSSRTPADFNFVCAAVKAFTI